VRRFLFELPKGSGRFRFRACLAFTRQSSRQGASFVEFHLLKGPEAEDHMLYASRAVFEARTTRRLVGQGTTSRCIWIRSLRGSRFARRWGAARQRHDADVQVAGGVNPNFLSACKRDATDMLDWNKSSSSSLGPKSGGPSHGSNNAMPEMRKTNGIGSHHLRPHRPPMHRL
jgi:hypothetical protein